MNAVRLSKLLPQARSTAAALVLVACSSLAMAGPAIVSHEIAVALEPGESRIDVRDKIVVERDGGGELHFSLNAHLEIESAKLDGRDVTGLAKLADDGWQTRWAVDITPGPGDRGVLVLTYGGTIRDDVEASGTLSFVVGDSTRGVIGPQGAYLSGGSYWYADDGELATFRVAASVPDDYMVVTQGSLISRKKTEDRSMSEWASDIPADGLALVSGKWTFKSRDAGRVKVGVYLSDDNLGGADILLDAAAREIATYSELLGPYAYDRFDIVENWFTTGYGMPCYTLLGKHVVARMVSESQRSGHIPPGYLDHEIVHCWWGNLVYPDYAAGNWCEGLTTYCSNYLAKERRGADEATAHRKNQCVRWTIRLTPERDYPIREFVGKTEDFENDIGYGKCSMVFHMLRRELGDEVFFGTLRRVAREAAGKRFGWSDWQAAFEASSKRNLTGFFEQWLDRTGAPLLELVGARLETTGGRMLVRGTLKQVLAEGEEPWQLSVPIVVESLDGREEMVIDTSSEETGFSMLVPSLPLRVMADPDHHVVRRLAAEEIPPCLAATLERPNTIVVYPDGDAALERVARMAASKGAVAVASSEAPRELPAGKSVVLLGDAERVPLIADLLKSHATHFPGRRATDQTTVLASARNPADRNEFITTFIGPPEALAARSRAVYYYQFDGRIVFEGRVPRERGAVRTPSRTSRYVLPDVRAPVDAERAEAMIRELVGPELGGRLAGSGGDRAARRLAGDALRLAGLSVSEQSFSFGVKKTGEESFLRIEGEEVDGAYPLVASPATPEGGVSAIVVDDPAAVLTDKALLVELPAASDPMAFVRGIAEVAADGGAKLLLVAVPAEVPPAVHALWQTGNHYHGDVGVRMDAARARGGHADPLISAAGAAARSGSDEELPLPVFLMPHGFEYDGTVRAAISWEVVTVESANVVARLAASTRGRARSIVLGAHLDALGPGFEGADDNASGVTAVIEAANVLSAHEKLLGCDVIVVLFGAEEWGLRGSRHFVETLESPEEVFAAINVDTIGHRATTEVSVIGISHHPRLAGVVSAALEGESLPVGKDIDRFAFAWGSDHWSFHEVGIPTVDLWSSDYASLHTSADTIDVVDPKKVTQVGRALAVAVLAVSLGF